MSPHQNALGWKGWLAMHWPLLHGWYEEQEATGEYKKFDGQKSWPYYCDIILSLREYLDESEWRSIVGHRFATWLEEEYE
jgi:hypothetical protein